MSLPLLLAGPILRRVEPTLMSVWVALRDPCRVRLKVWEGRAESGRPTPLAQSPVTHTLRLGARLNLVEVTVQLPATAGVSFQADSLYSYDLEITDDASGTLHTLNTLHMLEEGFFDGFARLPLGFEAGLLPSFAPPPSELTNLNLLYGSCRRPGHPTPDALAMVDDLIFGDDRYKDPRARPHQLFLGGDQIYADDVLRIHMLVVEEAAVRLIGTTGDPEFPDPIEHLPLDQVLKLEDETKAVDPTPLDGYVDEDPAVTAADPFIPADRIHFPEGRRLQLTIHDAQLTSEDGDSHLLSLGEFAALYLSVWSPAVWGTNVIGAKFAPDATAPAQAQPFRWQKKAGSTQDRVRKAEVTPRRLRDSAGIPPRPAERAASPCERADVHDPRRPRRHRRLLPQPRLAHPRARPEARAGDHRQRDDRLRVVSGLGQRPGGL